MSRTSRRPGRFARGGPLSAHTPHVPRGADPLSALRALVDEGIVAAAALQARNDLELAAASTQRLGALSSGMWRGLSRELATAADRLDRLTSERLADIERRARTLEVDPEQVVTVGGAAAHLAEHRERLETVVTPDQAAHGLLGPTLLVGFSLDAPPDSADEEPKPGAVEVSLYLWPTPLTPAVVSIVPSLLPGVVADAATPENVSLALSLTVPPPLLVALTAGAARSVEEAHQALIGLATACWTAHHLDELAWDEEDEDESEQGADEDRGSAGDDRV